MQIANDLRTTQGCRRGCTFVKQICHLVGSARRAVPTWITRAFVVFVVSPTDNNAHMAEHVYKKIEIVGSSPNGFEEAVQNALGRAGKTVRNMRWFEVSETRGYIDDGKIAHWQVTLKIGFTLDD
jgi:flavin-binding protein dodecin